MLNDKKCLSQVNVLYACIYKRIEMLSQNVKILL